MIKYFVLILTVFCLADQKTFIIDSLSTNEDILNKLIDLNKVPDFTLQSYDGEEYNMRSLEGKVVLLNFWATWCYPCRLEIPELNEFHEEYEDLIVLGLSISDTKKQLQDFSKLYDVKYPLLYGTSKEIDKISMDYGGIFAVPTSILIDRNGEKVFSYPGAVLKQNDQWDGVYSTLLRKITESLGIEKSSKKE